MLFPRVQCCAVVQNTRWYLNWRLDSLPFFRRCPGLHFDHKRRSKWVCLPESFVRPRNMKSRWWILPFIVWQGETVLDWRSAGHIVLHLHPLMVSWIQIIVETGLLSLVALLGVFLLIFVRYIPSSWAPDDNNVYYYCSEMLLGESVICLRIDYGFFTSQWTC